MASIPTLPTNWDTNHAPTGTELKQLLDAVNYALRPPAVLVSRTGTAISLTTGVITPITWDTEILDYAAAGFFTASSDTITIQVAGVYLVTGYCGIASNASGRRRITIQINGVNRSLISLNADTTQIHHLSIAGQFNLAVNDTVKLAVAQDSGGPLSTSTSEIPHMEVVYQSAP